MISSDTGKHYWLAGWTTIVLLAIIMWMPRTWAQSVHVTGYAPQAAISALSTLIVLQMAVAQGGRQFSAFVEASRVLMIFIAYLGVLEFGQAFVGRNASVVNFVFNAGAVIAAAQAFVVYHRRTTPSLAAQAGSTPHFPPQAYIIGAQKAATTSLASLLSQHPGITLSEPKEPDFYTNNWDKGLDWYRGCFGRTDTMLLDASTTYTMSRVGADDDPRVANVPQRIFTLRPDARFIYIVRDPAARTFSAYWHDVREWQERRSLREVVAEDPAYLDPGFYFAQISRYLEYFDLDRFLIIRFEDFVRDPVAYAHRCATFLGLAPFDFQSEPARNESFQYNRLGELAREAIGSKWTKRISIGVRDLLPPWLHQSIKAVVTDPVPRLGEDDRAWLSAFFKEDHAAFEALIERQRKAAGAAAATADAPPSVAVAGEPD